MVRAADVRGGAGQRCPAGRYNGAVAAIVGVDAEGTIRWWNEDAAAWFGHAAADVVGRPVDVLVPDEHRSRHWAAFRRVVAGGDRHLEGASINLPVLVADGRVIAFPARFN